MRQRSVLQCLGVAVAVLALAAVAWPLGGGGGGGGGWWGDGGTKNKNTVTASLKKAIDEGTGVEADTKDAKAAVEEKEAAIARLTAEVEVFRESVVEVAEREAALAAATADAEAAAASEKGEKVVPTPPGDDILHHATSPPSDPIAAAARMTPPSGQGAQDASYPPLPDGYQAALLQHSRATLARLVPRMELPNRTLDSCGGRAGGRGGEGGGDAGVPEDMRGWYIARDAGVMYPLVRGAGDDDERQNIPPA
jgi:hypothetical protein